MFLQMTFIYCQKKKEVIMGSRSLLTDILSAFPLLAWGALLFYSEPLDLCVGIILSVIVHEGGHYLAFLLLREPRPSLRFRALGLCLVPKRMLSYQKEIMICLCGPLSNLIFALCCVWLGHAGIDTGWGLQIGFLFAVVHLLPLFPLDGGRITHALFCLIFGFHRGTAVASVLSLTLLAAATFIALYFMLFYGAAVTLFFSCVFLFWEQSGLSNPL